MPRSANRRILSMAMPLMVGNMSQIFIGLTDTWFLGQLEGHAPLAAMAQAGVVYLIVFLVFSSGFMGIQTLVARRYGEEKEEVCGAVLNNGLALHLVVGALVAVLGFTAVSPLVSLIFGSNPEVQEVLPLSAGYLTIRMGGFVVVSTLWAFRGFFYGIGVTRPDIWAGIFMNAANIVLNYALVFGHWGAPPLGVNGAAWASVLATGLVALGMGVLAWKRYRRRFGLFRPASLSLNLMKSIMRLSAPRSMQAVAFGGSIYFFKVVNDECGEVALAASIIVWRILGVLVMTGLSFGATAGTLVGQSLGAGAPERAERMGWATARMGFIFNAALGLIGLLFPATIIGLFTDEPAVVALGVMPLRLVVIFGSLDAIGIILARALSAAGATLYVMWAEVFVSLGCVIPFLILARRLFPANLTAIWAAWVVYMVTWFACMAVKFKSGTWKHIKV